MLKGLKDATDIIRCFFEREYAFTVSWDTGILVRVAFTKGMWMLEKRVDESIVDYFEYTDSPAVNLCENTLLRGFLEEKERALDGKCKDWYRAYPASILTEALNVWGGALNKVKEINVIHTSRNSSFNRVTDEIEHSPD
eukprot:GHVR01003460.1.p2 GENE.GHVR01003460.1~~GHVR01003460.1.p2  ORF type:complete len:139 (-),score=0.66 GHVR01003460.1:200-616(-)